MDMVLKIIKSILFLIASILTFVVMLYAFVAFLPATPLAAVVMIMFIIYDKIDQKYTKNKQI